VAKLVLEKSQINLLQPVLCLQVQCKGRIRIRNDSEDKFRIQNTAMYIAILCPVLRIRIRDVVLFWSLDPGSGMEKSRAGIQD